jgi:RND family efflux transporter MFP subunit
MDDKITLIDQLRIERASPRSDDRSRSRLLIGAALVFALALAAAAWWVASRPSGIPVQVAIAREVSGDHGTNFGAGGLSTLDASGYVVARRSATVASKTIGRVVEVMIEEGQRVEAGQIIARLDDTNARAVLEQTHAQLAQAAANLEAAKTALDDAKPIFARNERQVQMGLISAQMFDAAKATYNAAQSNYSVSVRAVEVSKASIVVAQRNFDDTIVRAPFGGVITVKAAQAGEIVSPQSSGGFTRTGIGTIVDMDSLEVEVDVSESFINRVRPGQLATINLNAYSDWEIPAQVIAVIPTADRTKATVKVRVGFKECDERVLPEMGARVSFLGPTSGAESQAAAPLVAVMVPSAAVRVDGDSGTVFMVNHDTVERRVVRLGSRTSEGQLVLSGLTAGSRVAVGNLEALSDGAKIRIDPQSQERKGEGS